MIAVQRCSGVEDVAEQAFSALRGPNVAVSAGRSMEQVFGAWSKRTDFPKVRVFPADERLVSLASPDSNWRMIRHNLLDPLGLRDEVGEAAVSPDHFAALLREQVGSPPVFDSIFLGLGDDGHIASIFADSAGIDELSQDVSRTRSRHHQHERLTLSIATLQRARSLVYVAVGKSKRQAVARLLEGDDSLPAVRVASGASNVTLIIAPAADPTV